MSHVVNQKLASTLASFLFVAVMSTIAVADEENLILPQQVNEPVIFRVIEGDVDWETSDAADVLAVFVGSVDLCCDGRTPVAGRYESYSNALSFTPAFSFVAGQDYVIRLRKKGEAERLAAFSIPSKTGVEDASVTEIYPSGDILPENVLRFYIHFSVPMAPHVAFDYIKLRDASGAADDAAFMRFKQELWNQDRTRLTVLIDPGRIKRSVATNLKLGPALLEGERYILTVDGGWPSADGASVLPAFSKSFTVGEALRERPDVRLWQSTLPCPGTKEALEINFDRPIDRHQLDTELRLVTHDGQAIDGTPRIGENETFWRFVPNEVWAAGDLRVTVNSTLEDVAGNNFRDLLDQRVGNEDFDPSVTTLQMHLTSCPR